MNASQPPSPIPDSAGPASPAGPLARTLDALDTLRSDLTARVSDLDEGDLVRRAGDEGWTPVQVLQHLLLVERAALEGERRVFGRAGAPPRAVPLRRRLRYRLGRVIVALVFRLGIRVRVPSPRVIPEPPIPLSEIRDLWPGVSSELRQRLESAHDRDAAALFMKHPVSGPLTSAETAAFLLSHMRHHARQLDRILG
jgi:hypothetical protein